MKCVTTIMTIWILRGGQNQPIISRALIQPIQFLARLHIWLRLETIFIQKIYIFNQA